MIAALLSCAASASITLNDAPFHVLFAFDQQHCFRKRDIHRLTGTLGGKLGVEGGTLKAHVDNATMPDYTMVVHKDATPSTAPFHRLNATLSTVCNGTSTTMNGTIMTELQTVVHFDVFAHGSRHQEVALVERGTNPPPLPPPPPACGTTGAANQSACDAVPPRGGGSSPACSWCTSKDKVHALCFVATHKPSAEDWVCDR